MVIKVLCMGQGRRMGVGSMMFLSKGWMGSYLRLLICSMLLYEISLLNTCAPF